MIRAHLCNRDISVPVTVTACHFIKSKSSVSHISTLSIWWKHKKFGWIICMHLMLPGKVMTLYVSHAGLFHMYDSFLCPYDLPTCPCHDLSFLLKGFCYESVMERMRHDWIELKSQGKPIRDKVDWLMLSLFSSEWKKKSSVGQCVKHTLWFDFFPSVVSLHSAVFKSFSCHLIVSF